MMAVTIGGKWLSTTAHGLAGINSKKQNNDIYIQMPKYKENNYVYIHTYVRTYLHTYINQNTKYIVSGATDRSDNQWLAL